jgi:hypothetical protein
LSAPLVALALLAAAFLVLAGLWARETLRRPVVLLCPVLVIGLAALAFTRVPSPLDAPAVALGSVRQDPYALLDHTGGDRPAMLLLLAWPMAPRLGEHAAVAAVTLAALAVTTLLVWALARAAGLEGGRALCAQAVFVLLSLTVTGAREAHVAPLMGQAAASLLLVHLARRLDVLDGARDAAAASLFFLLALGSDAAGAMALATFTAILGASEWHRGDWRRALRLTCAFGVAAAVSQAIRYAAGVPGVPVWVPRGTPPAAGAVAVPVVFGLVGLALVRGQGATVHVLRAAFLTTLVLAGTSVWMAPELERARASYLAVPLAVAAIRPWRSLPRRTPADRPRSPSAAS